MRRILKEKIIKIWKNKVVLKKNKKYSFRNKKLQS